LHTLHLECCYILGGNNFGDLVASCPNLNKLILNRIYSLADINIHSTKLKMLTLDGHFKHLNLHTPYLTSAVIKLRPLPSDASKIRCNFNFSQFIASLSDVESISYLGPILEVKICDMPVFLGACYFTVGILFMDLLLFYSVQNMNSGFSSCRNHSTG
jgi:hypothetical protein